MLPNTRRCAKAQAIPAPGSIIRRLPATIVARGSIALGHRVFPSEQVHRNRQPDEANCSCDAIRSSHDSPCATSDTASHYRPTIYDLANRNHEQQRQHTPWPSACRSKQAAKGAKGDAGRQQNLGWITQGVCSGRKPRHTSLRHDAREFNALIRHKAPRVGFREQVPLPKRDAIGGRASNSGFRFVGITTPAIDCCAGIRGSRGDNLRMRRAACKTTPENSSLSGSWHSCRRENRGDHDGRKDAFHDRSPLNPRSRQKVRFGSLVLDVGGPVCFLVTP